VVSTLLTLLIVPAGFSLADGFEKRVGPALRKMLSINAASKEGAALTPGVAAPSSD
jgi:hypothetical protein